MFNFNEYNVHTLETDLIEHLDLEEMFVVSEMRYKPESNEMYCAVRKLARDAETFLTFDTYVVEIESGTADGIFSIQEVTDGGWRGDYPLQVAIFNPGYELELTV